MTMPPLIGNAASANPPVTETATLAIRLALQHSTIPTPPVIETWFRYASGDPDVVAKLKPAVEGNRRVTLDEILQVHQLHCQPVGSQHTEAQKEVANQLEHALQSVTDQISLQQETCKDSEASVSALVQKMDQEAPSRKQLKEHAKALVQVNQNVAENLTRHRKQLADVKQHVGQISEKLAAQKNQSASEQPGNPGRAAESKSDDSRALASNGESIQQETEFSSSKRLTRPDQQGKVDDLTGLGTRIAFQERVLQVLSQNVDRRTGCYFILIDLDHFSLFNRDYGDAAGDKLLASFANWLRNQFSKYEFYRVGGDEFGTLVKLTERREIVAITEAMRDSLSQTDLLPDESWYSMGYLTMSIGVACRREQDTDRTWYERADGFLYRSKQQGRNRATVSVR